MTVNEKEQQVFLEPTEHRYFHRESGKEYTSLSRVRNDYKEPFNDQMIAFAVAKKRLKLSGYEFPDKDMLRNEQVKVLKEWDGKLKSATDIGTKVDTAIDHYFATTEILYPEMAELMHNLGHLMSGYKKRISKAVVWSDAHNVAGEIDKLCIRRAKNIADYYDYKTNLHKGMQYMSKNNSFMKSPLDYMEDCNYNDVSLQLSCYALMGEICYDLKPGKLTAVLIDTENDYRYKLIPVPYMKHTAWAMLEHYRKNHNPEENF